MLVFLPTTLVNCPIEVVILSCPVSFVVFPLALVHVAILVNQSSNAMVLPLDPVAFVVGSIAPNLTSLALTSSQVFAPLADVYRTIC